MQGDVVAIYNESGAKVASYVYDAWGNFTTTYHNGGSSLTPVIKNPLLYRGYYYDRDLGMYYLQTRYYDSNIGRFLNADSALYDGLLGYNMYAYCNNDPVNYVDHTGKDAAAILGWWVFGGGAIAAIEPSLIGEIVVAVGAVALAAIAVVEAISTVFSVEEETPQSVTEDSKDDKSNDKKPSSPGKMQREVEKGQAPKDVESVHAPKNGKPHVHFKDGTSMNNDGTPHDKGHGIPKLTKDVKKWLGKHNWPTEIVFP